MSRLMTSNDETSLRNPHEETAESEGSVKTFEVLEFCLRECGERDFSQLRN
jgi:hypothetical protein